MARDYARTRNSGGNKKRRRSRAPAKRRNAGPPGWLWLVCGICVGLVVASGFYIFGGAGETPGFTKVPTEAADGEPRARVKRADEDAEPRFAFYEMLPNYEVVIPEEEYERRDDGRATTSPKVREPGRYRIQAGSFSKHADADRRKAELALLGLESEIESVTLDGGRTVYRVRSAPIEELDQLNKTLKQLRENDIDTLVMRAKKD